MADIVLDYGEEEERERNEVDNHEIQDMDAEMQDWEDHFDGDFAEYDHLREKKLEELKNARAGTKFYPLPREEGISAGANRGVTSQSGIDDADLQGPEEETNQPEPPNPIGGGQDIRYEVLHLSGSPVTQCSTSRLFAYLTHYGAQPLGLEWVNDSSCNVVFSDSSAARLAIEYLCPAISTSYAPLIPLPNDQVLDEAVDKKGRLDNPDQQGQDGMESNREWDSTFIQSLLFPRKAYRIPARLYNAPERDAAADMKQINSNGQLSDLPADAPEIYREMEAEERREKMMKPEQINLQKLRGSLWLRWALESLDVKPSRAAKQSKWYREHGNDAGKEVVTKILDVGRSDERLELLPSGTSTLPARPGWESARYSEDGARGRGGRKAVMDDLDADLDAWRNREDEEDKLYSNEMQRSQYQRRGRGDRRGRMTLDAVDEEMETNRRDRSSSPARLRSDYQSSSNGAGRSKVKGRGRMKAPSAWDDTDNYQESSMQADDYNNGGRRRRDHHHNQRMQNGKVSLEQRLSQTLEQRINGGRDLLDRMS